MRFSWHICTKPVVVQVAGKWYCKIHDPAAQKRRDSESRKKYDQAWAKRKVELYAPELLAACKAALAWYGLDGDGISDPVRQQLIDAIKQAEGSNAPLA
jgi:murein L,D-transpeptidase YcbB/YkuD